jgi:small GTP-binding protein
MTVNLVKEKKRKEKKELISIPSKYELKCNSPKYLLKIILIRAAGEGKIFERIIKKKFQENYKLTIGADFLIKDVEFKPNEIAKLCIWDIGMQKRFKSLRNLFYQGALGALLIFDLTREQSYLETKKWYNEIKEAVGPIPFIFIGDNVHLVAAAIREEAHEFFKNLGGIYVEIYPTSIDVVENVILELTQKIIIQHSIYH